MLEFKIKKALFLISIFFVMVGCNKIEGKKNRMNWWGRSSSSKSEPMDVDVKGYDEKNEGFETSWEDEERQSRKF